MNSRIYLFGQLGNGYTQYPTDYTQSYFQDFERNARAKTAICVQREGDLMLYQYLRRLSDKKTTQGECIGIAIVYNGVMFTDIEPLFHICEDAITNMVVNGKILEFTEDGGIISNLEKLYQADAEFTRIAEYLSAQLNALSALFEKLPPSNYALGKTNPNLFPLGMIWHLSLRQPAIMLKCTCSKTRTIIPHLCHHLVPNCTPSAKPRKLHCKKSRNSKRKSLPSRGSKRT